MYPNWIVWSRVSLLGILAQHPQWERERVDHRRPVHEDLVHRDGHLIPRVFRHVKSAVRSQYSRNLTGSMGWPLNQRIELHSQHDEHTASQTAPD